MQDVCNRAQSADTPSDGKCLRIDALLLRVDSFRYRFFISRRSQRVQRFILIRVSRLRWSGRKLRYDKSAQRVLSTPSPPAGYYPLGVESW